MHLYARPSWKLTRQIVSDAFVLVWGVGWWFTGQAADALIRAIAEPARQTSAAAEAMRRSLSDAAGSVATLPVAGSTLRQPLDAAAAGLADIVNSANQQVASIETVATFTGWLVFLIPVLSVIAFWLPGRLRFVRNSNAAARFIDAQPDLELLALRALATQPFHELAKISDDPVAAWRTNDGAVINALAELELRRAGLTRPNRLTRAELPS